MAQVIEIATPADFQAAFEQVSQEQPFVILYITGGEDAEGKSWCPDCIVHKKAIQENVINQAEGKILRCWVPTREEWKGNNEHPYKANPALKVRGVPSLLLMREGEVVARAETDEDFNNLELLQMIAKPE
eukprot:403344517